MYGKVHLQLEMAHHSQRQQWRHNKRPKGESSTPQDDEELDGFFKAALTLHRSPLTFNLDSGESRAQLAAALWSTHPIAGAGSISQANIELAAILAALMHNTYRPANREALEHRQSFRVEGLLTILQRAQSQKQMPLLTARLSIAALRGQLPESMWHVLSLLAPGMLASKMWTEDFVEFAREFRPPCPYDQLLGVAGVMFDNYTRKVLYASKATVEAHGYLLNMTNSATFHVPALLAPPNFDASKLCESLPHPPLLSPIPCPPNLLDAQSILVCGQG